MLWLGMRILFWKNANDRCSMSPIQPAKIVNIFRFFASPWGQSQILALQCLVVGLAVVSLGRRKILRLYRVDAMRD